MKLMPMTDFVLEQDKVNTSAYVIYLKILNYAKFLKQPLTLGMFVPCDDAGNVLEELKESNYNLGDIHSGYFKLDVDKYQQAKERVLFEFDGNLSLIRNKTNFYIIEDKNGVYLRILKNKTKTTIESLLKFSVEITLTETAIKQIGL